jgi:predicted  nucleic acid-binding Zn-ribbon protein
MNESPFQKFIDLVSFDQEIVLLEKKIQERNNEIASFEKEIGVYTQDLEQSKAKAVTLRKAVDMLEREMQAFDEQEKIKRKKLDETSNQKEYQSIKNELETIKKAQHGFEDRLLAAWKEFEAYSVEFDQKKIFCEEKLNALNSTIQERMRELAQQEEVVRQKIEQRSAKQEGIPAQWLDHYAMMRTKVDNPVVPVNATNCSACFYAIPQRDMVELRRGVLLRCRDCFRFLYVPTVHSDKQESA